MDAQQKDLAEMEALLSNRFHGLRLLSLDDDGTLTFQMSGACSSCPMHCLTEVSDILDALGSSFPQVKRAVRADDVSEETMTMVRNILGGRRGTYSDRD